MRRGRRIVFRAFAEEVTKAALALTAKFTDEHDQYLDVRREAARALGMIGPAAKACIPELDKVLTDRRPSVRREAAWTCGRMGRP
jgi:HEAT repeat protein